MTNKKVKGKKELERLKNKHEKNKKIEDKKKVEKITNQAKEIKNNVKKSKKDTEIKIDNLKKNEKIKLESDKLKISNKSADICKDINKFKDKDNDNKIKTKKVIKKKKRKKKTLFIILLSISLLVLLFFLGYYLKKEHEEKIRLDNIRKEKELIAEITSHYNTYVKTNKDAVLYNSNEEEVGLLPSDTEISLKELVIDKNTKYFEISTFEGYYIKYQDVLAIDDLTSYDNRYKKYIVFNENIVTKDKTIFYDENNNKVYDFNTSFDLPIIIKDTDRYGVDFNNRLLYINSEDVSEVKYNHNTDVGNSSGVAVLNYHAFYDENNYEERSSCVTSICHSKAQFKTHLDYLKENNILTLKTNELEMYIDGKIKLPKSVLITIDDGPKTEHAVNMLTEYEMYATIFVVTNWFNESTYYKTDFIELHSHTHDMHNGGKCPGGQGSGLKCLDRETLLNDLKTSREELGGSTVFCFPFYEYNSYALDIVKEAGFTMAFIGYYGNGLVKVGANKLLLPRYVITTSTTIYGLDYYFRQIREL